MAAQNSLTDSVWQDICDSRDLVPFGGICALAEQHQLALFYLPDSDPAVYALDNWCPSASANVLARGIVGDLQGELVVASPLYKDHFSLIDGHCIEKPLQVKRWPARIQEGRVLVKIL